MSTEQFTDIDQNTIGSLLSNWGASMKNKCPLKEDGDSIDIQAMHELEETKNLIKVLKLAGVKSSTDLINMGFVPAGMLLRFNSDND